MPCEKIWRGNRQTTDDFTNFVVENPSSLGGIVRMTPSIMAQILNQLHEECERSDNTRCVSYDLILESYSDIL